MDWTVQVRYEILKHGIFFRKESSSDIVTNCFLKEHGTSIYPFMNHVFTKNIPTMH